MELKDSAQIRIPVMYLREYESLHQAEIASLPDQLDHQEASED
jgi:hypothetical protein